MTCPVQHILATFFLRPMRIDTVDSVYVDNIELNLTTKVKLILKEQKLGFLDLGGNFIGAYRSLVFDITSIRFLKICKPLPHKMIGIELI
jgi:hypothetical protein